LLKVDLLIYRDQVFPSQRDVILVQGPFLRHDLYRNNHPGKQKVLTALQHRQQYIKVETTVGGGNGGTEEIMLNCPLTAQRELLEEDVDDGRRCSEFGHL